MKRSPMPQRKTELPRGAGLKRGIAPERKAAPKKAKPKAVPVSTKELLRVRSGGVCEVGLSCRGGIAEDPAHREGKKAGGTGKPWSNRAANILAACRPCHRLIDQVSPAAAERLGFKIREGVARPWEVPVKHARLGWVLLDDRGGYRAAPAEACPPGHTPVPVVACTGRELVQQDGAFIEAQERFGHLQCPGWSAPREGLFTCGCGSSPFLCQVIA